MNGREQKPDRASASAGSSAFVFAALAIEIKIRNASGRRIARRRCFVDSAELPDRNGYISSPILLSADHF